MSIFLHYDGVKGEASDPDHKDWIDVISWHVGTERDITANTSTRGDRESSNARTTELFLSRHMDSATPKLFLESCCGTGKTVKLHLTKTGKGDGADGYMEFTLHNALISKLEISGHQDSSKRPLETISISFVKIEVRYIPYDSDGNAMAPIAIGFDTATNSKS